MGITRLFEHPLSLAIVILLVVVLLGWKKLPDMARSLGRSSRILKSEIDEMKTESNRSKASQETVQGEPSVRVNGQDPVDGATRADSRRTDV